MNMRIKMTAKKVLESKGQISVSKAMLESGYPPTTAKNPQQVTKTKSWQQLMEKFLPDERLLSVHDELLDSKQDQIRLGAVGLGYKVKGKLQPETQNNFNVGEMSVRFVERKDD